MLHIDSRIAGVCRHYFAIKLSCIISGCANLQRAKSTLFLLNALLILELFFCAVVVVVVWERVMYGEIKRDNRQKS